MAESVSIQQRLADLEEWKARAERRTEQLEKQVMATKRRTRLNGGAQRRPILDGKVERLSRSGFLKKAGALVAGLAGAAALETRATKDAYAATDTNFNATGFAAGGGAGFFTQTTATTDFEWGAVLSGHTGLQATGSKGAGVVAYGAVPNSGIDGPGVKAVGGPISAGVEGTGGVDGANGVFGTGTRGEAGVLGISAQGYSGVGVQGQGGLSAAGVWGIGGSGGPGGLFGSIYQGAYAGSVPISLVPGGSPGPPTGFHSRGDVWVDSLGTHWLCTAGGNPGTFMPVQMGGLNQALFTSVSTAQYTLTNSDGATWMDLDAVNLKLGIIPSFKCLAILSGNADLWTSVAGFNQDIGIAVSGGSYPSTAGQPEVWKESGGFAGTFSPNAAFVQTVVPFLAGTAYIIKLQWKANRGGVSKIWAGAGPIGGRFSATRLTAVLMISP